MSSANGISPPPKVILMNSNKKAPFKGKKVDASYSDPGVDLYRGNPYIEALPQILFEEDAIALMRYYPHHEESYHNEPDVIRLHLLTTIQQIRCPLKQWRDVERLISRFIRGGYLARNPLQPAFFQSINNRVDAISNTLKEKQKYDLLYYPRIGANCASIIGVSGLGKTTVSEQVLSTYPQSIQHREYRGQRFTVDQVVWLKLECPHNGSTKALCLSFFDSIDDILGTNYSRTHGNPRYTEEALVQNFTRIALIHGLGLLVIDEVQHLNVAKSGGADKLLNFFVGLVNRIGVPVLLIGTPKAADILTSEFRLARRMGGYVYDIWDRLKQDDEWEYFLKQIWKYQYIRKFTPFTQQLSNVIYSETQGVTDFVIKLFIGAQIKAIESKVEELTSAVIKSAAKDIFRKARPFINALKTNNYDLLKSYGDIYVDIDPFLQSAIEKHSFSNPDINQSDKTFEDARMFQVASRIMNEGFSYDIAFSCSRKAMDILGPDAPLSSLYKVACSYLNASDKKDTN